MGASYRSVGDFREMSDEELLTHLTNMIEHENFSFSDWELKFIDDLNHNWDGTITPSQRRKLEEIAFNR